MEQFNSGESSFIFEINSHKYSIGLMSVGKLAWQHEDEQKGDSSTVLMFQEQFFASALFKDIQDAISLILHYRTMYLFRTISSSTFITLDVRSIYIPSPIQD